MITFLTCEDPRTTALLLDMKRLGKQRVEAIQIAQNFLVKESRWHNHPAFKMWKGYEAYLVKVYLRQILAAWKERGGKNIKAKSEFYNLYKLVENQAPQIPWWFTKELFESHQSNLVRKDAAYYRKFFPSIPEDLPYLWPVR